MAMYGCHHSEGRIFMLLECIQLVIVYNIRLTVPRMLFRCYDNTAFLTVRPVYIATQIQQPNCLSFPGSLLHIVLVLLQVWFAIESTPALQLPQLQVVTDYQALAIVLPIALVTILIVAAIVGVGVVLCVRGTSRKG